MIETCDVLIPFTLSHRFFNTPITLEWVHRDNQPLGVKIEGSICASINDCTPLPPLGEAFYQALKNIKLPSSMHSSKCFWVTKWAIKCSVCILVHLLYPMWNAIKLVQAIRCCIVFKLSSYPSKNTHMHKMPIRVLTDLSHGQSR